MSCFGLLSFVVVVCLSIVLAFVYLLACLLCLVLFHGGCNRDEGDNGGPRGEQNWGAWCEPPKVSIKKY